MITEFSTWVISIWNSVDRLSWWITAANVGIAATILLTFALTAFTIAAASRRDALQKLAEGKKDALIATANKQAAIADSNAAEAHRRAGEANEAAALANERAARLEAEAEQARLQAEKERLARTKLEQRLAPRSLTAGQAQTIANILRGKPAQSILLTVPLGVSEPLDYAQQIKRAVEQAGWKVDGGQPGSIHAQYSTRDHYSHPLCQRRSSSSGGAGSCTEGR